MKKIFQLSWPVMCSLILQNLLGTVDMMYVGKLGTIQLSSVGISNSILNVIFVLSTLVSSGVIAIVSQNYGQQNLKEVKEIGGQSYLLSLILGLTISILSLIFAKEMLKIFFNPDIQTLNNSYKFSVIAFSGIVIVFLNSTLRTILQAIGDTKTPLFVFGFANLINVVLDPILMFKFNMGIQGAALATVISNIIGCILITIMVIRKIYESNLKQFFTYLRLNLLNTKRILKIGGWACIKEVARPFTGMLMTSLVYYVGKNAGNAAFSAGMQLLNYTFIFLNGLCSAIAILVGQSIGKGEIEECDVIIKSGIKLGFVNMLVFSIVYFIFPEYIMKLFSQDTQVINMGVSYLRIVYVGIVFVVYPMILGGVFQGAGDTFPPMISSIVANVALKLPIAYILAVSLNLGTNGVWISISLSVIIEAIMIIYYYKKETWKEIVV